MTSATFARVSGVFRIPLSGKPRFSRAASPMIFAALAASCARRSGEPLLAIRAPIIEAQLPETYLLSAVTFQTLVASKAARCVLMSGGPLAHQRAGGDVAAGALSA